MSAFTIETGARLHFGLLSHRPESGRHFGGAGLMIDSPGVKLTASPSSRDEVIGPAPLIERVGNVIATYRERTRIQPPPCRIVIENSIPPHQGLGSGTQLALAAGKALALCADEGQLQVTELARRVNRGARSALGIHGFQQGGFLVDGGKSEPDEVGRLITRTAFPGEWRILLVTPPAREGLSGSLERDAFQKLHGMPEAVTNRLCRILLMEILPAVLDADFANTAEAIYQFGQEVGAYFEPIQGGRFAHRQMEELAASLRDQGIRGVGQSSWGPTLFVIQESQAAAESLQQQLLNDPLWSRCQVQISQPRNQGAVIQH